MPCSFFSAFVVAVLDSVTAPFYKSGTPATAPIKLVRARGFEPR